MSAGALGKNRLGVYELYRYDHPGGGSKDWAIAVIDGAVDTRYGKIGTRLQGGRVDRRFTDNQAEVRRRINGKIRKGYRHIGSVVIYEDGSTESVLPADLERAPRAEPKQDDEKLYFEIRLRGEAVWSEFLCRCREACDILEAAGVTVSRKLNGEFNAVFAIGGWPFEVAERSAGNRNTLSRSTLEGAGHLRPAEGVYPLLFLMYLKRFASERTYEVGLAFKDGIEVTEQLRHEQDVLAMFGVGLDDIRPVAVALGLAEKEIDLASIGSEESLYF